MKKYLITTSIILFISMISFSLYNGSIYIEGVDKLTANIISIHIEIGFANYFISKFIYWLINRERDL